MPRKLPSQARVARRFQRAGMAASTISKSSVDRPHYGRAILAAAVGCLLYAATPASAVTIELKDVASDRVERQRAAAEGNLPLAGTPDLSRLSERLAEKGVKLGAPVLLRVFKSESEFEVWIRKDDTSYVLFATYPVCHWSGTLGPKLREGDKQTPEGFYTVTRGQMRHIGRWPRSLNLGFPNAFDQAQARNGSHILVHGGCSSVGCFAMTNAVVEEIYGFVEKAVAGGQTYVPVHVFPFRMTDANLALQKDSPWQSFWSNLKEGHDFVERTKRPPRISVCDSRYKFQDLAPEEGATTSPLAVCGATHAALEALERLPPAARTQLSLQMNPYVAAPRSLPADLHRYQNLPISSGRNHAMVRRDGRPSPAALLGQQLSNPGKRPPPCSMARASCRHFVAVRDRANERRNVASGRKRHQQAAR
ncbi:MAG: murein L,D-transpeptidase family protein [Hyphomicrobiaceae bacterium]